MQKYDLVSVQAWDKYIVAAGHMEMLLVRKDLYNNIIEEAQKGILISFVCARTFVFDHN